MDNEPEKSKRTLLPRFSIRALFWIITISGFAFVVLGMAARGEDWAWGISLGIASLLLTMLVHGAWFGIVWLFSLMPSTRPKDP